MVAITIPILLSAWSGQAESARAIVSLLMNLGQEVRRDLPSDYEGVWAPRDPTNASATEKRRRLLCVTRGERSSVTIHSFDTPGGRNGWRVRELGSAFMVDGVTYTYVVNQVTNLAIGRVLRFQGTGESRTLSALEPNSLRRALETRGLPFTALTTQLEVDAGSVMEILRSGDATFDEIATMGPGISTDCPNVRNQGPVIAKASV